MCLGWEHLANLLQTSTCTCRVSSKDLGSGVYNSPVRCPALFKKTKTKHLTRWSPEMCHSLPSFCPPLHSKACSLNSNLSKHPETGHLTVCLLRLSRCVRSLIYDTMGAFRGSICVCLWFDLCKYWSPLRPVSSSCQHISGTEIKYRGEEQIS